jgi:hypothetical protein
MNSILIAVSCLVAIPGNVLLVGVRLILSGIAGAHPAHTGIMPIVPLYQIA